MATGDGINKAGLYVEVQASNAPANGAISTGAVTDVATAIPNEKDYYLLDFKVIVTAGTPVENSTIDIYKKNSDQAAPTATYLQTFVGSAVLNAATGSFYLRGVPNDDSLDTYYALNKSGVTLTFSLQARGRTYRAAV